MKSYLSHLECIRCSRTHPAHKLYGACDCGGPLFCHYRLDDLKCDIRREDWAGRATTLWRYGELLPANDPSRAVTLGEGLTPLIALQWGEHLGLRNVWVKDEGQNPTGTFKARGASVGVTLLREHGVDRVVVSSSGNAGEAWAVYARRAGLEATIILPDDVPMPALIETVLTRQTLHTFGGHNSRGGRLARSVADRHKAFCANTYQEPYRLEGKKTMGLELAEQLGWRLPDVIIYPTGGGVGLLGIWKAFQELIDLGWVEGPLPRFVVAQYEGCAPFVEAVEAGREACEPWGTISTLPGGLRNAKSAADFLLLKVIRETRGTAIAVSTEDTLTAVREVMASDGLFMCPEAGTTIVALRKLVALGQIKANDTVAVVNTGTGLKYASLFQSDANRLPDDVEVL